MINNNFINKWNIENAIFKVSENVKQLNLKRNGWSNLSEEDLWYELVSCILGSRVCYETSNSCIRHLRCLNVFNPYKIVSEPNFHENCLISELSRPIFCSQKGTNNLKYPFPKIRSNYIVSTAMGIYNNGSLKQILENSKDEYEARERLVESTKGIGYKQASLFLRNVSFSKNLAILDSHVIKYMQLMDMINNSNYVNMSKKYNYLNYENILYNYANDRNQSISDLDLAIWIVMRLVQREYKIWQQ